MMLVLVEVNLVGAGRSFYFNGPTVALFRWRTHGRKWAKFIVRGEDLDKLAEEIGFKELKGEPLPRDPEKFFEILRKFIDFLWTELPDGTIIISTPKPGKMIGKGGRVIRAIRQHLGRKIKVTEGKILNWDLCLHAWLPQECYELSRRLGDYENLIKLARTNHLTFEEQKDFTSALVLATDPQRGYMPSKLFVPEWGLTKSGKEKFAKIEKLLKSL